MKLAKKANFQDKFKRIACFSKKMYRYLLVISVFPPLSQFFPRHPSESWDLMQVFCLLLGLGVLGAALYDDPRIIISQSQAMARQPVA